MSHRGRHLLQGVPYITLHFTTYIKKIVLNRMNNDMILDMLVLSHDLQYTYSLHKFINYFLRPHSKDSTEQVQNLSESITVPRHFSPNQLHVAYYINKKASDFGFSSTTKPQENPTESIFTYHFVSFF